MKKLFHYLFSTIKMFQHFYLFDGKQDDTPQCTHTDITYVKGMIVCERCGLEVEGDTKDWKYFGLTDVQYSMDPTQCFIRKTRDRSIYEDVQHLNICDRIKDLANSIYVDVCGTNIHRGSTRKAIVFASIYHAYKMDGDPQSCENLIPLFKIQRKEALKGLKYMSEFAPQFTDGIAITPEHLIVEFAKKFKVPKDRCDEIVDIYKKTIDSSRILNRSRPQSVASGIIWYWLKTNNKSISIDEFTKKVELSELTVTKLAKEVGKILKKKSNQ